MKLHNETCFEFWRSKYTEVADLRTSVYTFIVYGDV